MEKSNDIQDSVDEVLHFVSFYLGNEIFGIDILRVQEIIKMSEYTRVPNAPQCVKGVINLRGKVLPVISLRAKLGLDEISYDKETRIVVVAMKNKVVSFIVDRVNEVMHIPSSAIEPPPSAFSGIEASFISSIAKLESKLLIIMNLEKMLESENKPAATEE
jgi:purine-binding chemotaxis protein CheW